MKRLWCRLFHRRILWPTSEKYLCAVCLEPWYHSIQGDSKWYERRKPEWLRVETERIKATYGYQLSNFGQGSIDWLNNLFSDGK